MTMKKIISAALALVFLSAAQPSLAATTLTSAQIAQLKSKLLQIQKKQQASQKNITSTITKLKTHINQVKKQRSVTKGKRAAILKNTKTKTVKAIAIKK